MSHNLQVREECNYLVAPTTRDLKMASAEGEKIAVVPMLE